MVVMLRLLSHAAMTCRLYVPADVFGVLALIWAAVLYTRACYYNCYSEMVLALAHCM